MGTDCFVLAWSNPEFSIQTEDDFVNFFSEFFVSVQPDKDIEIQFDQKMDCVISDNHFLVEWIVVNVEAQECLLRILFLALPLVNSATCPETGSIRAEKHTAFTAVAGDWAVLV
jgi:hypothetical protein